MTFRLAGKFVELSWLHSSTWELSTLSTCNAMDNIQEGKFLFPLNVKKAVRILKKREVNVTKGNNLPCLVLHHRKYPDPISGSNNTVKRYYANHFENSFDPHTTKEQYFVIMLEVEDNYGNVMGLLKVFEQTAQLDFNCLGVKSCSN